MLSVGELRKLYSKDFIVFETDPVHRNRDEQLKNLPQAKWTPNFLFVDARGKIVLETRGFNNPREAKAIHEYVSQRHYQSTDFRTFMTNYPER